MALEIDARHPLRDFFAGLVEQVFMTDLGVCSPALSEYLSELLVDFIHVDEIYRMRTIDGQVIRELSRIQAEAYLGPGIDATRRNRLVNKYIGDFTLFWTGLYPEQLRPRVAQVDRLREYLLQGKRSYGIASELSDERARPPATVLRELSAQFEYCVHGLYLVRESWRQAQGEARRN
jgi:hypothetical protein